MLHRLNAQRFFATAALTICIGVSAFDPGYAEQPTAAAAQALLPAVYRESGVLNVAASTVDPPHAFLKEGTDEWTGYEIDLFNAIADVLKVKVKYTQAPFQQLVSGVGSGRSDVAIGDLGDNDLRQQKVDFVDHAQITFQLTVSKGNPEHIRNIYDLCGRDLAIIEGTTDITQMALSKCSEHGKKPPHYVSFPDQTSKFQAVKSGRVTHIEVTQTSTARYYQANNISPDHEYVDAPEVGNLYIGFIVKKDNKLSAALLAAEQVLFANGTYAKILAKWNISDHALKAPGINIGSEASNWVQPKS